MSWNWKEEREVKEYDVKGTVTISTEEYRDLIGEVYELQAKGQREHDDWYKEYNRARELEEQVKALKSKVEQFNQFLSGHKTVKEDWENYFNKKRLEELGDE